MKIVVDTRTVAHLWANEAQKEARTSNNSFYFFNKTIYSYGSHFPIAKHVENEAGETAVLFTTRSYSSTTSCHKNIVRMACNHLNIIFCYNPGFSYSENFEQELKEAENVLKNLTTARKPEKYLMELHSIQSRVKKYADFLSVEIPDLLQNALNVANKEEYSSYLSDKADTLRKAEAQRQAKAKKDYKAQLKNWLALKTDRMYTRLENLDYLRIKTDIVETSQGIKMTIEEAGLLQKALINNRIEQGQTVLKHYTVKSIDNQFLTIGCHRFKRSYLENFKLQ